MVLGSGTSFGVPVIGCHCPDCTSDDPKNRRTRTAAVVQSDTGERLLIDTPPELRLQMQNDWAPSAEGPRVIILDSRGELASVYSWAWVAFVGGTLVPIGGHNLLEPAGWGKPVFFGPFTDHCREIAGLLLQGGGGVQVQNGEELAELFLKSFRNRDWTEQMGQAAREIVREHQGVVPRNLEFITKVLDTRMAQSQGTFVS